MVSFFFLSRIPIKNWLAHKVINSDIKTIFLFLKKNINSKTAKKSKYKKIITIIHNNKTHDWST